MYTDDATKLFSKMTFISDTSDKIYVRPRDH